MTSLAQLIRNSLLAGAVLLVTAATLAAQGVEPRSGSSELYGTAANCSQPATIDYDAVKKKTPEWKTIVNDNVPESSGRYQLLMTKLNNRIRKACETVAIAEGRDCVMKDGDISNDNGLEVSDLTSKVKSEVSS